MKIIILLLICGLGWGMPIQIEKEVGYDPCYGGAHAINQGTPDYSIIASIPRDELWKVYVLIVFACIVSIYGSNL
jgi:hypothetical protein